MSCLNHLLLELLELLEPPAGGHWRRGFAHGPAGLGYERARVAKAGVLSNGRIRRFCHRRRHQCRPRSRPRRPSLVLDLVFFLVLVLIVVDVLVLVFVLVFASTTMTKSVKN